MINPAPLLQFGKRNAWQIEEALNVLHIIYLLLKEWSVINGLGNIDLMEMRHIWKHFSYKQRSSGKLPWKYRRVIWEKFP
jgi:hypothetical protein